MHPAHAPDFNLLSSSDQKAHSSQALWERVEEVRAVASGLASEAHAANAETVSIDQASRMVKKQMEGAGNDITSAVLSIQR